MITEEDKICLNCRHFDEVDANGICVCYKAHRAITSADNSCGCWQEPIYSDEDAEEEWR